MTEQCAPSYAAVYGQEHPTDEHGIWNLDTGKQVIGWYKLSMHGLHSSDVATWDNERIHHFVRSLADVILTRAQVSTMTGWELLTAVGIYDPEYRTWRNNEERNFQDETGQGTWRVYSTSGRGKQSRTTYVHLYRNGKARIVDSFGTDTGQRMPTVYHYRGKASDKISTYHEID
jgi:hypothetical protein